MAGVVIQTIVHGLSEGLSNAPSPYLSANSEGNPITWAHGVAIFASAYVSALVAVTGSGLRRSFAGLAVILAFLSLDEMTSIHERAAGQVMRWLDLSPVWDSVVWPVLYVPLLVCLTLLLFQVSRDRPRPARRLILAGVGLLAFAVLAEMVSAPWSDGRNLVHSIEGAIEEAAELAGWMLIALGLTAIALLDWAPDSRPVEAPADYGATSADVAE